MALRLMARWPEPLTSLMPILSSWDDMHSQARMKKLAAKSSVDLRSAPVETTNRAHDYCSEGVTTRELAWFHTTLLEKGVEHLIFEAETLGVRLPVRLRRSPDDPGQTSGWADINPSELLRLQEWREMMAENVPIKRVWGATGLFWALLFERLQAARPFRTCTRCGRMLPGKHGKRFCGFKDNPSCFRDRRATDMRRLRTGQPQ